MNDRSVLAGMKMPEKPLNKAFQQESAKVPNARFNVNIPAPMLKRIKAHAVEKETSLTALFMERFSDFN